MKQAPNGGLASYISNRRQLTAVLLLLLYGNELKTAVQLLGMVILHH